MDRHGLVYLCSMDVQQLAGPLVSGELRVQLVQNQLLLTLLLALLIISCSTPGQLHRAHARGVFHLLKYYRTLLLQRLLVDYGQALQHGFLAWCRMPRVR